MPNDEKFAPGWLTRDVARAASRIREWEAADTQKSLNEERNLKCVNGSEEGTRANAPRGKSR